MTFKLDENLGTIGKSLFEADGHDVATVTEQRLSGAEDAIVYEACRNEDRILVTLDQDFCHALRFPPEATAGIVVLACKGRLSPVAIVERMSELAELLRMQPIDRELWIVEPGRIRIRERKQT